MANFTAVKNIIVILLALVIGCSEDKYCFECTTKVTTSAPGMNPSTSESVTTKCEITNDEAEDIEKGGTKTVTSGNVRMIYQTSCRRK